MDLRGINLKVLLIAGIIVAVAISTKLLGCGLSSLIFLKDKAKSMRVEIGMTPRGEVGLIVAGVGVTTGALSTDIYTVIIMMGGIDCNNNPNMAKEGISERVARIFN